MRKHKDENLRREDSSAGRPSVLIVDDNHVTARAVSVILSEAGYWPTVCHSGGDALEHARHNLPAAALLDIHLPDISGLVLSAKLRQLMGPDRPIIVLSGDTSMENLRSLSHVGADWFIAKPFKGDRLVERLRQMVAPGKQVALP